MEEDSGDTNILLSFLREQQQSLFRIDVNL